MSLVGEQPAGKLLVLLAEREPRAARAMPAVLVGVAAQGELEQLREETVVMAVIPVGALVAGVAHRPGPGARAGRALVVASRS